MFKNVQKSVMKILVTHSFFGAANLISNTLIASFVPATPNEFGSEFIRARFRAVIFVELKSKTPNRMSTDK